MSVLGDILYRAASLWQPLAGNITSTKKFLTQTGTGAVSAAPGWNTIVASDLPNTAVTPASYGDATHVGAFTVDAQGRLTAASSVAITYPASGDFSGPASAVSNDFVMFNGTTGKLGKDNGTSLTLSVGTPGVDTLIPSEKAVRSAITAGGFGNVSTGATLTSGKTIIGAGTTNIDVSTLTAQFVGSSSGTEAAASMTTARLLGRTTAGSGAVEELTVGTGLSLSAGSLTATGGTSGFTQLAQIITAGSQATVDFTSISGAYSTLKILYFSQDTQAGTGTAQMRIRVNNDSTAANYTSTQRTGASNSTGSNTQTAASTGGVYICNQPQSGNTNISGNGEITITGYAGTTFHKMIDARWLSDSTGNGLLIFIGMARWKSTAAITRLTFTTDGTAFTNGSTFTLYGIS